MSWPSRCLGLRREDRPAQVIVLSCDKCGQRSCVHLAPAASFTTRWWAVHKSDCPQSLPKGPEPRKLRSPSNQGLRWGKPVPMAPILSICTGRAWGSIIYLAIPPPSESQLFVFTFRLIVMIADRVWTNEFSDIDRHHAYLLKQENVYFHKLTVMRYNITHGNQPQC